MTEKELAHVDSVPEITQQATGGQGAPTAHTEGPWTVGGTYRTHNSPTRFWETCGHAEAGHAFYAHGASQDESHANAEFIVRACNAHDELLAALKGLTAAVHDAGFSIKLCVPETAHLLRISNACMAGLQVIRKAEHR
jgi:hypothetical protein